MSTGNNSLDKMIQGGLPEGSVVALTGSAGTSKKQAGIIFINRGIEINQPGLIITTKYTPHQYKSQAEQMKISLEKTSFLDAASWRLKRVNPKLKQQSSYEVSNITDLNALLAKIMEIQKENGEIKRIFFDSISSLLMYTTPGPEQVYKFFELLSAFIRTNKIGMLYSLEKDVHEKKVLNTLLYLSDGHIEVKTEKNEVFYRPQFMILSDIDNNWTN